jgi:hypothetical protein
MSRHSKTHINAPAVQLKSETNMVLILPNENNKETLSCPLCGCELLLLEWPMLNTQCAECGYPNKK